MLQAFAVVFAAPPARAGTIPVGASQSDFMDAGQPYSAYVGYLQFQSDGSSYVASGTLIADNWVLTAAHVGDNATNMTVSFGGQSYDAVEIVVHDSWNGVATDGNDLALVRLNQPVSGVVPASLYSGSDELGAIGTYVGYGRSGDGNSGVATPPGVLRAGRNRIDSVGLTITNPLFGGDVIAEFADSIFWSDFDDGQASNNALNFNYINLSVNSTSSATPLEDEYMIAGGDSGGGVFLTFGSESVLAGVISFGLAFDGVNDSDYGDLGGSIRVSKHMDWITSHVPQTLAQVPEPTTASLLLLGLALLSGREARRRA